MFFFQSMFQQVYNGITGSTTLTAVQSIAQRIRPAVRSVRNVRGIRESWRHPGSGAGRGPLSLDGPSSSASIRTCSQP